VGDARCHAVLGIATADGALNYDELVVYDTAAILPWLKVTYEFTKLVDDAGAVEAADPEPDPGSAGAPDALVADVQRAGQRMGCTWSVAGCTRALAATGQDLEQSVSWCFSHQTDPNFDQPPTAAPTPDSAPEPAPQLDPSFRPTTDTLVAQLQEAGRSMGCTWSVAGCTRAVAATDGDLERAVGWCLSHQTDQAFNDPPDTLELHVLRVSAS
jgi:hypothetical protein